MLRRRLVLVALVVLVFSTIAQVSPDEPSRKLGFGELLTMVEQKRIARVDLNGRDHTLTAVTTAARSTRAAIRRTTAPSSSRLYARTMSRSR